MMCMQNQMINMTKIQAKIKKVAVMMMGMITKTHKKEKNYLPIY